MMTWASESPLSMPTTVAPASHRPPSPHDRPLGSGMTTFTVTDKRSSRLPKDAALVTFTVDERYTYRKLLGCGAFGCVVAVNDGSTIAAIKKIPDVLRHEGVTRSAVRELKLLRLLGRSHPNVLGLKDVMIDDRGGPVDLYLVSPLMDADLERVIASKTPLTFKHIDLLFTQLLSGLAHMHTQGIVHRDLKPANCLVNNDCRLRICDLGMSRAALSDDNDDAEMTDYVVSRWYRPPEVVVGSRRYSPSSDVWSAGTILAELVGRTPLLPGHSSEHQLELIAAVLGAPTLAERDTLLPHAHVPAARQQLCELDDGPGVPFATLYPHAAGTSAVEFLELMLRWNPAARVSAHALLAHPSLEEALQITQTSRPVPPPPEAVAKELQWFERHERDVRPALWAEARRFRAVPEPMKLRAETRSMPTEGSPTPTPPADSRTAAVSLGASPPSREGAPSGKSTSQPGSLPDSRPQSRHAAMRPLIPARPSSRARPSGGGASPAQPWTMQPLGRAPAAAPAHPWPGVAGNARAPADGPLPRAATLPPIAVAASAAPAVPSAPPPPPPPAPLAPPPPPPPPLRSLQRRESDRRNRSRTVIVPRAESSLAASLPLPSELKNRRHSRPRSKTVEIERRPDRDRDADERPAPSFKVLGSNDFIRSPPTVLSVRLR